MLSYSVSRALWAVYFIGTINMHSRIYMYAINETLLLQNKSENE